MDINGLKHPTHPKSTKSDLDNQPRGMHCNAGSGSYRQPAKSWATPHCATLCRNSSLSQDSATTRSGCRTFVSLDSQLLSRSTRRDQCKSGASLEDYGGAIKILQYEGTKVGRRYQKQIATRSSWWCALFRRCGHKKMVVSCPFLVRWLIRGGQASATSY